jgi:tRNA threonylcarbamoyl adenosine modification protein YeaZ
VKVLAIETSSASASISVAADGEIVAVRRFDTPRGRGAEVFTLLDEMRAAWSGIDRLAIGLGPGSYNGLRVACALAGSVQMALGVELATAPSCCLLNVDEHNYRAIGDARGGRVWFATVKDRRLAAEIELLPPDECLRRISASAAPVYRVGEISGFEHLPVAVPDASVLALLAPDLPPADAARIEPIYLKPPHITAPRTGRP